MTAPAEQPIPIPAGFPVDWPDPDMETLFWTWDQQHHPHPKTPLTATYEGPAFSEGASRGFQALGMPVAWRAFIVNGYWFGSLELLEPAESFPPPWWPRVEAEFTRRLPNLLQTWEQEYLPEVQAANQRLRDFDHEAASAAELLAFVDETFRERVRMYDIHMQVVMPVMGAASRLAEMYEQFLGKPRDNEPYLMLQGYENLTVESGKALWELSRRALGEPDVARIIAETPVEESPDALKASAAGRVFWDEFERYLEQYGWRSDAFDLADPAWAEDPTIPLRTMRDLMEAPDGQNPALKEQRSREERERLVQDAMERLDGNAGKPIFEMILRASQQYLPIQENHNFHIDQAHTVLMRRQFLEVGRRLAGAGALADRDDVFYLTREELPAALTQSEARDWKALVAERKAERERWAAVLPPREMGTRPPESLRQNPMSALFFGVPSERSSDPKVITGLGASAGTVTATARIVRSLSEADKLQPGDVLVCDMTMPAWTPLFASVSAVVADSGGMLSHCAIIAREYRIPCIVGTEIGTQVLKDGQRVTVDGAQGIVRIED